MVKPSPPAPHSPAAPIDWTAWMRRWDAQQQYHIPRREERFQVMLELVSTIASPAPAALLDLACGPGSISARARQRFPESLVVALDVDPFLLAMGQGTFGDGGGRLRWVQADLLKADWVDSVRGAGPFDAVLTSTAMHWLPAGELLRVYRALTALLRPGGLFLNAETLLLGRPVGRFAAAVEATSRALAGASQGEGESWSAWWEAARAEPAFAGLLEQRERAFHGHPHERERVTAQFHEEALAIAGFAETAVVWRYLNDTIVGAIR